MTTPLSELEALRWLKDSAAQEPELPAATRTQLWTRLARDVSTLPLVCTGAATTLGESGAANAGAATTLGESGAASSGAATTASLSRALGVSAPTVIARLAIWSAPALVVGAVGGVTWQRAAVPERVHTVHVDRVASPAQSASAATAKRDNPIVEASPAQSAPFVATTPNESDLPLVTESEPPFPEPGKVSASDDQSASTSSAEPRAGNAPSSAEPRAGNAPSSAASQNPNAQTSNVGRDAPSSAHPNTTATSAERVAPSSSAEPHGRSALARERAVLDRARVALAAGEAERALAETKRHVREFPNGILGEEREAIAINGLVRLGRYTQASQRAARFRARYPKSLMMQSVDAAMATAPHE